MLDATKLRLIDAQFATIRQIPAPIKPEERYKFTVENLKKGSVLRFAGMTYAVAEVSKYVEGKGKKQWTWTELKIFCLETGETVNIEWEKDDEIEISITTAMLAMKDLRDDEGADIDEDDIEAISNEGKGVIMYNSQSFSYDDDYGAAYHRDGSKESEEVYFYDFMAADGTCLTVEEWGNERDGYEYQVYLSRTLNSNEIEIIAV